MRFDADVPHAAVEGGGRVIGQFHATRCADACRVMGHRHVGLGLRPGRCNLILDTAELALVIGEIRQRQQDDLHPLRLCLHRRPSRPPEDQHVLNLDRDDRDRTAGPRRFHQ